MKQMTKISIISILFSVTIVATNRWPNHDISTLKLLQVVHRHGERGPASFSPNDPFKNESYWPEGFGELTSKGKYRMYKLGQFIRQEYGSYLGDKYSPGEVYARSALSDRCIESVSCLLSGAYPPKQKTWKWNEGSDAELGSVWQPFPIQTSMPANNDHMLTESNCAAIEKEVQKVENRTLIKKFNDENREFYKNLSKITGAKIDSVFEAGDLYDGLRIELDNKYIWNDVWTEEEMTQIVEKLSVSQSMTFRYLWDSPITQRLITGELVKELNKNFQNELDHKNDKKMYVYSTHDSVLTPLMQALKVFDIYLSNFGSTLFFELHQRNSSSESNGGYFVRLFYHNETVIDSGTPHSLRLTDCHNSYDCPIDVYFNSTKYLLYENFDKECLK